MALIFSLAGEMAIVSPAGSIEISLSTRGMVVVNGVDAQGNSMPRTNARWYLDQIKGAREAVKTGKAPEGFTIKSSESKFNKPWLFKMLQAAEDVARRELPSWDQDKWQPTGGNNIPLELIRGN